MFRNLTCALALTTALVQPALAQDVTTGQLDNGMQVVVIEDHRAPVVVQMVWYRTGSADEPPGASGVAHFLEHLLFKATDNLEAGELSATVTANGGSDNAFTSYDYTAYFQRVAADRLELMMQMESDRMNNLRLTEEDILTERQVVIEERNQRTENSATALAREQIAAAQYLNHRYGAPVIGWMHELQQLNMADVLSFYDLYYSPNNAVLVVAGDVQPDEVMALAQTYYGVIPAEENLPERYRPEEPPQRAERRLVYEDPRVGTDFVTRSYLAPERDPGAQETAAALVYLSEILGGSSFTSVLGRALMFDTQTALFAGAGYSGMSLDRTTFTLTVAPQPGVSLEQAEIAMDAALAQFMEDGVDPAQFERIRTQLRASEIYALDNVEGIANRYGAALTQGLTVQDVQDWPRILQEVTPEDVMTAAALVLNRNQAVTAYITSDATARITAGVPVASTDAAEAEEVLIESADDSGATSESAAAPAEDDAAAEVAAEAGVEGNVSEPASQDSEGAIGSDEAASATDMADEAAAPEAADDAPVPDAPPSDAPASDASSAEDSAGDVSADSDTAAPDAEPVPATEEAQ